MAGAALRPGVVIARDGKIDWVGPAAQARIPDGFRVLEAAGRHARPGRRPLGGRSRRDPQQSLRRQLAGDGPGPARAARPRIQPQLRAVDAYNAREELVAYLRSFGVTTVHTGHGPGALASGQTMIVKTRGDTVDEAVVEPLTMIAFTLGTGRELALQVAGNARQGCGDAARRPDQGAALRREAGRRRSRQAARPRPRARRARQGAAAARCRRW